MKREPKFRSGDKVVYNNGDKVFEVGAFYYSDIYGCFRYILVGIVDSFPEHQLTKVAA